MYKCPTIGLNRLRRPVSPPVLTGHVSPPPPPVLTGHVSSSIGRGARWRSPFPAAATATPYRLRGVRAVPVARGSRSRRPVVRHWSHWSVVRVMPHGGFVERLGPCAAPERDVSA
jgi:hypothetical protein